MLLLLLASSDLEPFPFDVSSEGTPALLPFLRLPPDEPSLADNRPLFLFSSVFAFSNVLPATLVAFDSGVILPEV